MVKGCKKNMIWLKNTGSELFEEAYFIVSEEHSTTLQDENVLLKEANRIVAENQLRTGKRLPKKEYLRRAGWWCFGASCSALVCFVLFVLLR